MPDEAEQIITGRASEAEIYTLFPVRKA